MNSAEDSPCQPVRPGFSALFPVFFPGVRVGHHLTPFASDSPAYPAVFGQGYPGGKTAGVVLQKCWKFPQEGSSPASPDWGLRTAEEKEAGEKTGVAADPQV